MADDAVPTPPSPSPSSLPQPDPNLSTDTDLSTEVGLNAETTLYQFFYILDPEDVQACCVGAESLQGAVSPDIVQLLCLQCDRVRHCPSHRAEIVI